MTVMRAERNNFDLLRLILASLVMLGHFTYLTRSSMDSVIFSYPDFAVEAFFVLSGYLIYGSFSTRPSLLPYFVRRACRIYPLYTVVVIAQAIAMIALLPDSALNHVWEIAKHVIVNLGFANFLSPDIGHLTAVLREPEINPSMWTLKIEVGFYIILPALRFLVRRFGIWTIFAIFVFSSIYSILLLDQGAVHLAKQLPGQLRFFAVGIALHHFRDQIRPNAWLATALTLALLTIVTFGGAWFPSVLHPLTAGGVVFLFGRRMPAATVRRDISYGVYLLHGPVIQIGLLMNWIQPTFGGLLLVCAVVYGLAWLAARLIEAPAIAWGKRMSGMLRAQRGSDRPARISDPAPNAGPPREAAETPGDHGRFPAAAARSRFLTLEIGRGIAAIMVVVSHAVSLIAEPRWLGTAAFDGWLANMNVGVDFFFVLSGFIVTFVHWDDFGRPDRLLHYANRRFARVFPPYWVILTVIVPIYLTVPSFGVASQHDWLSIVTSYLLIPMPQQPVLGVAWTLTFELFFYVLLALVIGFGRRALALFVMWGIAIVVCLGAGLDYYPFSFFGSAYGLQFLLGMAVAAGLRKRRVRAPGTLLGVGLVGFFLPVFLWPGIQSILDGTVARLVFGAAAGLIIAGAIGLERAGRLRAPALLVPLGAASYAIYLTHVVTESALIRLFSRIAPGVLGPEAMLLALSLAAVAGGLIYHYWVERPLTRAVRRRLPSRTPAMPKVLPI
jgi:exopolysaccharide production protein ExoZ